MVEEIKNESVKKECFVIMPISNVDGYEAGHFDRVYEYLIKPAIESAGYVAGRSDKANKTDYIVISIIQKIMNSDVVVCDMSSKNPNVLYELGIRHAFDKPVIITKDKKTDRIFDIDGLRYIEYDHSLRIDNVKKEIDLLKNTIINTMKEKENNVNSIVKLAQTMAAKIPEPDNISFESKIILNTLLELKSNIEKINMEILKSKNYMHLDSYGGYLESVLKETISNDDVQLKDGQIFMNIDKNIEK